jgi:hypothetical protein
MQFRAGSSARDAADGYSGALESAETCGKQGIKPILLGIFIVSLCRR